MFNRFTRRYNNSARFVSIIAFSMLLGITCVAPGYSQAQDAQTDSIMQASAGETAGSLAKGELLATALKREKVDAVSARQAIKSIGDLFDFRLSRTGDRYVFKLSSGRKLAMLRYQRGQHIFEAIYDDTTGEYTARILKDNEIAAFVPTPAIPDNADDDGEIDVEHAAMAKEIQNAPAAEDNTEEETSNARLNDMEVANPDDPIFPEDPALADKPSPDAEFPEENRAFANVVESENADSDDLEDELLNAPVIPSAPGAQNGPRDTQETAQNQLIPETNIQNEPYHVPTTQNRTKKAADPETSTFSMVSMVMFILGLIFMLFSFFTTILPNIRKRKRAGAAGLRILESISTAPGHSIACVEQNGHAFLISIHPDTMSFIAPCPPNDDTFWTRLKSKTYWYQMAQKPLSDRQIAALMEEIHKSEKHQTTTMRQSELPRESALDEDDSTAILVTSLDDNGLLNEKDEDI